MIRFARGAFSPRCGFYRARSHGNNVVRANTRSEQSSARTSCCSQVLPRLPRQVDRAILIETLKYLNDYQRRNARFNLEPIRRLPRTRERSNYKYLRSFYLYCGMCSASARGGRECNSSGRGEQRIQENTEFIARRRGTVDLPICEIDSLVRHVAKRLRYNQIQIQ